MTEMGFALQIVSLILSLYENQKSNIRTGNGTSEWFAQHCTLSPYLYNIRAKLLMQLAMDGYDGGFRISGRLVTNLWYADDIVFIVSSHEGLQELVSTVHNAARSVSIKMNLRKMETMKVADDLTPTGVQIKNETHSNTSFHGSTLKRRV